MPSLLLRWVVTSLSILAVPYLVSGVQVETFGTALAAAVILGVLNVLLRPILFFLTLPLTILSFGLFILVLNAAIFQLAGKFVTGLRIENFGAAFWGALIVSAVSWIMNFSMEHHEGKRRIVIRGYHRGIDLRKDSSGKWG